MFPSLILSLVVYCSCVGCSEPPASVPWSEDQKVIAPESAEGKGQLVVETAVTGSDASRELHAPYFVYDEGGRLVDRFPNENLVPVRLPSGRFIVVSRVCGRSRRVQVEIRKTGITYITLKDFNAAPTAE